MINDMKNNDVLFGTIRKFCSRIDRVSICRKETLDYENYKSIKDVPESYDQYFLYGFGMIESEFDDTLKKCIEIMISKEPRNDI